MPAIALAIALILATGVTMIFGELVPKNLAIAAPLATAKMVQRFQRGFTIAAGPIVTFFNGTANAILRRIGVEPQEELASARSAEELTSLVRRSAEQGTLERGTATLLQRALAFGERSAHEIMTPRGRVDTVDEDDPVTAVVDVARASGHSRFPVLGPERRRSRASCTSSTRSACRSSAATRSPVGEVMDPPVLVPESLELDDLLDTLREGGLQMALVVDEFGNVTGLVTLEDLVEEIVGEVHDEHDESEEPARRDADGSWTLPGLMRPDEIRRIVGLQLPEDEDYETRRRADRRPAGPDPGRGRRGRPGGARRGRRAPRGDADGAGDGRAARRPGAVAGMSTGLAIAISAVLLVLNAFFVGAEFALISARRSAIEDRARAARPRSRCNAMEHVSLMMAGAQLGITICSLGLGYLGEPAIAHLLEGPFEAIGSPSRSCTPPPSRSRSALIGYLHVVLGEMVPKNLALAGPDRAALRARAAAGDDRPRAAPGDRAAELVRQPHAARRRRASRATRSPAPSRATRSPASSPSRAARASSTSRRSAC